MLLSGKTMSPNLMANQCCRNTDMCTDYVCTAANFRPCLLDFIREYTPQQLGNRFQTVVIDAPSASINCTPRGMRFLCCRIFFKSADVFRAWPDGYMTFGCGRLRIMDPCPGLDRLPIQSDLACGLNCASRATQVKDWP